MTITYFMKLLKPFTQCLLVFALFPFIHASGVTDSTDENSSLNSADASSEINAPEESTTPISSQPSLADGFITRCSDSTALHCKTSQLHIYNNTDFPAVIGLSTGGFVALPSDTHLQQNYAVETSTYGTELRVIKKILLNVGNKHGDDSFLPCAHNYPSFPIKLAPGHVYEVDVKYNLIDKTCSIDVQKHINFNT